MSAAYQPGSVAGITAATADYRHLGAAYSVSLPVFEGPLDLLLHLIEQERLDISAVSLVAVTDQYLRTIERMEQPAPGALADFLVVASRLLYIKSTRLLPKPVSDDEEQEDAGAVLVRHLLEYRQFKRVAEALRLREAGARVHARPPGMVELPERGDRGVPAHRPDLGELDAGLLRQALQRALARRVMMPPAPSVQPYTVTVAERMEEVRRRFAESTRKGVGRLSFAELLAESDSRLAIIVTFLAVLELVKQGELLAVQAGTFGEILLLPISPDGGSGSALAAEEEERAAEETRAGEAEDAEE